MAVSPKLTSSRIRDPLAVRERLWSLSIAVEKSPSQNMHSEVVWVEVCVVFGLT